MFSLAYAIINEFLKLKLNSLFVNIFVALKTASADMTRLYKKLFIANKLAKLKLQVRRKRL